MNEHDTESTRLLRQQDGQQVMSALTAAADAKGALTRGQIRIQFLA